MFRLPKLYYIERTTGERCQERVYGEVPLTILYPRNFLLRVLATPLRWLITRNHIFSKWYGARQRRPGSRKKVAPFVEKFELDANEFEKPIEEFVSFDDFFVRKLKPEARPIADTPAVIPADGRYRFFPNAAKADGHYVKGQKFSIAGLLQDEELAKEYEEGAMCIARLCPTDYHRFHFPCAGTPSKAEPIDGLLLSVNLEPLRQNIHIFSQNKRQVTQLVSDHYGKVLIVEVGATCVGTIHQTYTPGKWVEKGEEKGFFSFGGSAMILLFESLQFANDLLGHDDEVHCLMGQSLI